MDDGWVCTGECGWVGRWVGAVQCSAVGVVGAIDRVIGGWQQGVTRRRADGAAVLRTYLSGAPCMLGTPHTCLVLPIHAWYLPTHAWYYPYMLGTPHSCLVLPYTCLVHFIHAWYSLYTAWYSPFMLGTPLMTHLSGALLGRQIRWTPVSSKPVRGRNRRVGGAVGAVVAEMCRGGSGGVRTESLFHAMLSIASLRPNLGLRAQILQISRD